MLSVDLWFSLAPFTGFSAMAPALAPLLSF
jgi:hypothetical protein